MAVQCSAAMQPKRAAAPPAASKREPGGLVPKGRQVVLTSPEQDVGAVLGPRQAVALLRAGGLQRHGRVLGGAHVVVRAAGACQRQPG